MTDSTLKATASRRGFLQWSIFGLLFALFAGTVNVVFRFLTPPPPTRKARELTIPVSQIPPGSSMIVEYKGVPTILIHTEEGFSAYNAVCTHLGCIVKWVRDQKIFYCPCHAGKFDRTGKVLAGPPPEPLHKIDIEVRGETIIFV